MVTLRHRMKFKFAFLTLLLPVSILAQTGGTNAWQFLDLDFSARSLSLGSDFVPLKDGDINLAVSNPASITPEMDNNLSMNHFIYPAGINYGMLAFGKNFEKLGTFTGHLRYVSYGKFTRTDASGIEQGTFTAGDYAMGRGMENHSKNYFQSVGILTFFFYIFKPILLFGVGLVLQTMSTIVK